MKPENQRAADLQVIAALKSARSDMSKPHRIEHHFVSKKEAGLASLRSYALSQRQQVSKISSTGSLLKTYFFDIVIDTVPAIENMSPATTAMHQLAAKHPCTYDGWGCMVVE
jgi:regulator of RNase E activity RraB